MGFWIYMFVMNLFIPLTMVGFGKSFMKKAPKEINLAFGYRSSMSMMNKDTWTFAHHYLGRLWYIGGLLLLPITIIVMLFLFGKSENIVETIGTFLCMTELVILAGAIIPTEIALRKAFDKEGNRRDDIQKSA